MEERWCLENGKANQNIKACSFMGEEKTAEFVPGGVSAGRMVMLARRKKGLSQEKLGEQCGLSRAQVSRIECGKSSPRCGTIRKLERILNVSLMERFVREELEGKEDE